MERPAFARCASYGGLGVPRSAGGEGGSAKQGGARLRSLRELRRVWSPPKRGARRRKRNAGRPRISRYVLIRATYSRLDIQVDPDRHVIGGALPGAHVLVDAGGEEPVGRLRRHQHVVDADAVVLLPGAGLIIPERV